MAVYKNITNNERRIPNLKLIVGAGETFEFEGELDICGFEKVKDEIIEVKDTNKKKKRIN